MPGTMQSTVAPPNLTPPPARAARVQTDRWSSSTRSSRASRCARCCCTRQTSSQTGARRGPTRPPPSTRCSRSSTSRAARACASGTSCARASAAARWAGPRAGRGPWPHPFALPLRDCCPHQSTGHPPRAHRLPRVRAAGQAHQHWAVAHQPPARPVPGRAHQRCAQSPTASAGVVAAEAAAARRQQRQQRQWWRRWRRQPQRQQERLGKPGGVFALAPATSSAGPRKRTHQAHPVHAHPSTRCARRPGQHGRDRGDGGCAPARQQRRDDRRNDPRADGAHL